MDRNRRKVAHVPHTIDIDVIAGLEEKFRSQFERTSSNRFRSPKDMQYAFAYSYFLISEQKWPYEIEQYDKNWYYLSVKGDPRDVIRRLTVIKTLRKKFTCINDDIEYDDPHHARVLKTLLKNFYKSLFSQKSSFEL